MAITIFLPKWWTSVRSFCGKTVRWPRAPSDPLGLSEYFKIMFLTEARAYIRTSAYIEEFAPALRTLYRRLERTRRFSGYGLGTPPVCGSAVAPSLSSSPIISAQRAMGHPMLKGRCVQ